MEEANGGGREQQREGGREGGREQGREGNSKGGTMSRTLASIQHTAHKITHNAALAFETLILQIKSGEQIYKLCSVIHGIIV